MVPAIQIIIFAVIGFMIKGFTGLLIGAVAGWLFAMVFGSLLLLISGGILPRKIRRETASSFYKMHPEVVTGCTQQLSNENRKVKFVEKQIERIYRKAMANAPMASPTSGTSLTEIRIATEEILHEEKQLGIRELLTLLELHIEEKIYL